MFALVRLKPARLVTKEQAVPERGFARVLANKWYVDEAYDRTIVKPVVGVSRRLLWTVTDTWLIDGLIVNGSAKLMSFFGRVGSYLQTGSVSTYAWAIVLGVLVVLGAFTLR
jgi:NADH-quinone oxidoreductase subunit L